MGSEKLEKCPCCGGTGRAREHDGKDWAICGRDECSMSTSWIPRAWWRASALRSRVSELESRASRAETRVVEIEAERAETEAKLAAVERRNGELESAMLRIRKEAATIDDALTIIDPFDLSATARRTT